MDYINIIGLAAGLLSAHETDVGRKDLVLLSEI
jgi:hypothetical protein